LAGTDIRWLIRDAIDARMRKTGEPVKQVARSMVAAFQKYCAAHPAGSEFAKSAKTFFSEPTWRILPLLP
jgi:hypothetical protein